MHTRSEPWLEAILRLTLNMAPVAMLVRHNTTRNSVTWQLASWLKLSEGYLGLIEGMCWDQIEEALMVNQGSAGACRHYDHSCQVSRVGREIPL